MVDEEPSPEDRNQPRPLPPRTLEVGDCTLAREEWFPYVTGVSHRWRAADSPAAPASRQPGSMKSRTGGVLTTMAAVLATLFCRPYNGPRGQSGIIVTPCVAERD
jgi:hypothetical protein